MELNHYGNLDNMKKDKKESVRHTILITLGEMAKKKMPDSEEEGEEQEYDEEDEDLGGKIVLRMMPKSKKNGK
jgi:hypothetical protein